MRSTWAPWSSAVQGPDADPDQIAEPGVPAVPAARASGERVPRVGAAPHAQVPAEQVPVGQVPPGRAVARPEPQAQVPVPGVPVPCAAAGVAPPVPAPAVPEPPGPALPVQVRPAPVLHEPDCLGGALSPRGAVSPQGRTVGPLSGRPVGSPPDRTGSPVSGRPAGLVRAPVRPPSSGQASAQRTGRDLFPAPRCPAWIPASPEFCRPPGECRRARAELWVR